MIPLSYVNHHFDAAFCSFPARVPSIRILHSLSCLRQLSDTAFYPLPITQFITSYRTFSLQRALGLSAPWFSGTSLPGCWA